MNQASDELWSCVPDIDSPASVRFANRVSCNVHSSFVDDTVKELLRVGSLVGWPVVANGMGVVLNRKGKKRLILDCRYVNQFILYAHFNYESLSEVTQYL